MNMPTSDLDLNPGADLLGDALRAADMHALLTRAASGLTDHVTVNVLLRAASFCGRAEAIATQCHHRLAKSPDKPGRAAEIARARESVEKAIASASDVLRTLGLQAV